MYNNQRNNHGNYQHFGQRLPPPPLQQPGPQSYGPPVSIPPNQSYLIPPPPLQNPNWGQNRHVSQPMPLPGHHLTPRIPPPHPHGQQFYRVPPPLPPPVTSSYFAPASFGSFAPPPPPPVSTPPGPPPLPPSSPSVNRKTHVYGNEMSANDMRVTNIVSDIPPPPPKPKDENTVRKIEVLCQYIAKNGNKFEDMTRQKEIGNPEFEFLFGGEPGSEAEISHEYYKWMKKKCGSSEFREGGHNKDLSLELSGVGSFMQPNSTLHDNILHSPACSDMDMDDDITQHEEPSIGILLEGSKHEPSVISNEVELKAGHACDSEHISHKDACVESSVGIEQGAIVSQDDMQFEKSTVKVDAADSERSLVNKAEQSNVNLPQKMNQSEQSPFKLIQGYASDDGSKSDNEPHFENISPEAVSPHFKENDIESKNASELAKESVPLFINLASKVPEPSTKTEDLENRVDKQNDLLRGDDGIADPNFGRDQKEGSNVKLEVDEFGRMVKKGGKGSDSDDYITRRRGKRGRSRSRSPNSRRRRSPRRRRDRRSRSRDRRSRSHSRSPIKRSGSRSPYRRNRSYQQVCLDHRRGMCHRPACRYIHEPDTSEESRRHRNRQRHYEESDRLKFSDKLLPEKNEVSSPEMRLYQDVSRSGDKANEEFREPSVHSTEVAGGHETLDANKSVSNVPSHPAAAENYPLHPSFVEHPPLSTLPQPATTWNTLPPPPPNHQVGGPMPQYQMPFQANYPLQPLVTPYGSGMSAPVGVYSMNYPILQRPGRPMNYGEQTPAQFSAPSLISSNSREPPPGLIQPSSAENIPPSSEGHVSSIPDFGQSRITSHYNPYASTFDNPLTTNFSSGPVNQDTATSYKYGPSFSQNNIPAEGQMGNFAPNLLMPGGGQYDPLFDSVDPSSNSLRKSDHGNKEAVIEENDEFGETADAEVGAVENDSPSPSSPIDLRDVATGDVEIDQVKTKKSKDSRSMKLFKVSVAEFVKEVLKPSWRQGNMSKEAFKTIVKKTVDKVSGAMKKHQVPKTQAKINHYIDSSQRKLTKLVMGYVDKYVKV
uniref:uncharacterized protein LOC122578441 isoform X2 n=1 Tax=Erigeron canadensis TaxID=72917 RepID=UPI001CB931D7|nr:uncharacterized protein LOC122578441 isoform X2 [Erigeron canadensis]